MHYVLLVVVDGKAVGVLEETGPGGEGGTHTCMWRESVGQVVVLARYADNLEEGRVVEAGMAGGE